MDSGYTTVHHWLEPRKAWLHCAPGHFPSSSPPLPGLGHWAGGRLWPSDDLVRIITL